MGKKKILYKDMTPKEIEELIKKDVIAIVPIGAVEEHGLHLPMNTDTYQIEAAVYAAAEKVIEEIPVVVMPTLKYGSCTSTRDFPGAITIRPQILISLLTDLLHDLDKKGVKKIVLANGHGGNNYIYSAVYEAIGEGVSAKIFIPSCLAFIGKTIQEKEAVEDKNVGHACQIETSMMMYLRPDLVRYEKLQKGELFSHLVSKYSFIRDTSKGVSFVPNRREHMKIGARGDSRKGTKKRGKELIELNINGFVDLLHEIHNQS